MKKLIYAITTVCLLAIPSNAQQKTTTVKENITLTSPIPVDPSVTIGKLSNGLTYYIKQNAKPENKVELRLALNVGSILEDEDQKGLAHFMEHMNFNGTKNFKKNELVDYLQSIGVKFGAHLNAYTGFDQTVYILPIPSDDPKKLEKGFQILEDWAQGALLTDTDINEERGIVLEEYRSRSDADSRMLERFLPKLAYGSKYPDRLPIGTKENIETFKPESIRRFHKDWYRPDLMAVIAVGNVDTATLEEKIKTHFNNLVPTNNSRERKVENLQNHKETLIAIEADKEAPFSRVNIYYKDYDNAKPSVTINDYRNDLLNNVFAQMLNNRLDELRNSENPPFVFGYSGYGGTLARTKNAYRSVAVTSPDGHLKGLQSLLDENERVKRFGFTEGELDRAKKNIIARYEKMFKDKDKQESKRIVSEYINNFLEQEPIPGIEWELNAAKNMLPTIQLNEVNQLIKKYLHDDNRVVIITGPKKVVTQQQVLDALHSVKTKDLKPYKDEAVANSLLTKAPTPGTITGFSENDALGTKTFTLSNGAKVTYKKTDFKNDEILFKAFSFGGTSLYSDEEIKAIGFANGGLSEAGINGFSKTDVKKMLTGKIVNVRPYISNLSEGFSGSASPKDLETLFQMVHLYFTSLNKNEKAYNSYINKNKSFLGNLLANPNFYFQKEMADFLHNGDNRFVGFPSVEVYNNSNYDLAYQKYQERFADAGDFNFYFVGNLDEKKLAEYATKYIAGLPAKNSNESYKAPTFRQPTGSHTKVFEKGTDPKSMVRIMYQGEANYNKKDALAFKSLGEVVSIKLIEKLREKEAGVYSSGTRATMQKAPYGWYNLTVAFPCAPENVKKLTDITVNEVANIVTNGPTSEDLDKTKKALILQHKEDVKKNNYWLNLIEDIDFYKNDANDFKTYETRINALTKEDIQNVAKKYLTKGYILGILNPEKK